MRVIVKTPYSPYKKVLTLEQALTPAYDQSPGEGTLEALQGRCRQLEDTLGRLLVELVKRDKLTIESAAIISGNNYSSIEPAKD